VEEVQVNDHHVARPLRAEGADEMDENELVTLVTRNGLIGTASR
jgi:hypothetical protein